MMTTGTVERELDAAQKEEKTRNLLSQFPHLNPRFSPRCAVPHTTGSPRHCILLCLFCYGKCSPEASPHPLIDFVHSFKPE